MPEVFTFCSLLLSPTSSVFLHFNFTRTIFRCFFYTSNLAFVNLINSGVAIQLAVSDILSFIVVTLVFRAAWVAILIIFRTFFSVFVSFVLKETLVAKPVTTGSLFLIFLLIILFLSLVLVLYCK